jgi:hypothetical protein
MLTHARLAAALMRLDPGGATGEVLGVPVRRLPADAKWEPSAGRYRIDGGEIQLLLVAMDTVTRLAQYHPVPGGLPWQNEDGEAGPVPSYGRP